MNSPKVNRPNRIPLVTILLVAVATLGNFGCGGGQVTPPPPPPSISVSVSLNPASVEASQTAQATATVSNDSANRGVTWTLSCSAPPCGSVSPGSTSSGAATTYTAPASPPAANLVVTLTATSVSDTTKTASATATVPAIAVTVTPALGGQSLEAGETELISATVNNDLANHGVTWTMSPANGAGTLTNVTSASATYNAPPVPLASDLTVTITATSEGDPKQSASAVIPVMAIHVDLSSAALVHISGSVHLQAGVAYDPNGAGVTWELAGCTSGPAACGTVTNISNSGPYSADYMSPSTVPPGGPVTITATSVTDPTKSASASVTISPINFTSQNYAAGNSPAGVVVADFNGDGKLDIAVADEGNPSTGDNGGVSILLGNGDGTFQPAVLVPAGKNPIAIVAGDFNNDGKQDLVVSDFDGRGTGGNGSISVLLGNGDGTFQAPVTLRAGTEPFELATGDFNGDGKLDFAVTDVSSGAYIFVGNGDGTFQPATLLQTGNSPSAIAVRDLNGDGKLDLAVGGSPLSGSESSVSILLGKGDATFASPVTSAAGEFLLTSIAAGDLNGDGKADLAITVIRCGVFGLCNSGTEELLGNGDGTFQPVANVLHTHSATPPLSAHIADLVGSGKPDLIQTAGPSSVAVLPGKGDGTFIGVLYFDADVDPFELAIGDFNGDGKPDAVVANNGSNDVTVLLNASVR